MSWRWNTESSVCMAAISLGSWAAHARLYLTASSGSVSPMLRDVCTTCRASERSAGAQVRRLPHTGADARSEEHTSELQSPVHLVCRLLLEKKKNNRLN